MTGPDGYSGTPLEKKLGYREGMTVRLIGQPDHYFSLFRFPLEGIRFTADTGTKKDLIHFFIISREELQQLLPLFKEEIRPSGCIWVSRPKKASRVVTEVTEDVIRDCASREDLVDIKVCSVDATWSALKLVIPLKKRDRA